jgi:hypothetical protein
MADQVAKQPSLCALRSVRKGAVQRICPTGSANHSQSREKTVLYSQYGKLTGQGDGRQGAAVRGERAVRSAAPRMDFRRILA